VAQEVQQVLPSIVRGTGKEDKHLSVVYQDLIALLTLAAQMLQDRVAEQQIRLAEQQTRLQAQEVTIDSMREFVTKRFKEIEDKIDRWTTRTTSNKADGSDMQV
jgi:hypothetical protein